MIAVWTQHKTYLQDQNDDREPRQAFLKDLKKNVAKWIEMGDQVLVCGDLNHNVLSPKIVSMFQELQMTNLIFDKHDESNAPSTYYRNEEGQIVDGMWGTPGLQATQCGYLRPEEFAGNNSLLWIDVLYQSALGHNPPRPRTLKARRLQLYDKRCVRQYLWKYEKSITALQLPQRQFKLEKQTKMGRVDLSSTTRD
jgi:hypothetical protein